MFTGAAEGRETAEDELVGGMTDDEIKAKHLRLRGSMDYKYPPREASCRVGCGFRDYLKKKKDEPPVAVDHRCFLAIGHRGPCEFSSECVTFQNEIDA